MADRPPLPGQMPSSFDGNEDFYNERPMVKVVRKIKEEPLVPLGIGLTVFAFVGAYRALRRGDSQQANKMFRARVAAQGFTVIAMVAGSMYYSQDREKTKELRKLKEEHDAEEKRQKWIRELEARDDEEKSMRARYEAMKQKAQGGDDAGSDEQRTEGTGGMLGKMGLWAQGEKKAQEEAEAAKVAEAADAASEKKGKRENPRSSLGAIGEAMSKKKGGDEHNSQKESAKEKSNK